MATASPSLLSLNSQLSSASSSYRSPHSSRIIHEDNLVILSEQEIIKSTLCQSLKLKQVPLMLVKKTLSLWVLGLLDLPLQYLYKGYIIIQTVK